MAVVPVLPTGLRRMFFVFFSVLSPVCFLISSWWHWIRSDCPHAHTQRRLQQVINYVCKGAERGTVPVVAAAISLCVCAGVEEDNTGHWKRFVAAMADVQMLCWCVLVCMLLSSAVFFIIPHSSPNLSRLPMSSAEITNQHPPFYLQLICI